MLRVFAMPLLLALVSCVGLLSALLADGVWDAVSWIALGLPVAVIFWHIGPPADWSVRHATSGWFGFLSLFIKNEPKDSNYR